MVATSVALLAYFHRLLHSSLVALSDINTRVMNCLEVLATAKGCGQLQAELNHLNTFLGGEKSVDQLIAEHGRLINLMVSGKGCNWADGWASVLRLTPSE